MLGLRKRFPEATDRHLVQQPMIYIRVIMVSGMN